MNSVLKACQVDTHPGGKSSFSPPEGWEGTSREYVLLMRDRFQNTHHAINMHLTVYAKKQGYTLIIQGPHREAAQRVIDKIQTSNQ